MTIANIKDEKNIGKATKAPAKRILIVRLNFKSTANGKEYTKISDNIKPTKNHIGLLKGLLMIIKLANNAIIKIDEKTTAFTIQVDPKRRENVVTLFVSSKRKPLPKKKNKGFIFPIFRGVKIRIDAKEITISIMRVIKYRYGIPRSVR